MKNNCMRLDKIQCLPVFRRLELPLGKNDAKSLENEIIAHGYNQPFLCWNNYLLFDFDVFDICKKYKIKCSIKKKEYPNLEVAISEICKERLVSDCRNECLREYLIGSRFIAEKELAKKQPQISDSHYTYDNSATQTRAKLAKEYGVSEQTIYKYVLYAETLNNIADLSKALFFRIVSEDIKVSRETLHAILKMSDLPRKKAIDKLLSGTIASGSKKENSRGSINAKSSLPDNNENVFISETIKGIPKYDPNSELKSLIYTVPTWNSSLNRVKRVAHMSEANSDTKNRLRKELINTISVISDFLYEMEESSDG